RRRGAPHVGGGAAGAREGRLGARQGGGDDRRRDVVHRPGPGRGGGAQVLTITSRVRGPCTPSTRFSSMSLVAEGPLIQVSGRDGSSRATASGTPATIWSCRTTHRW